MYQDSCHIAIFSTISITLLFQQIKVAVDTLTNACVSNPAQPSQGGRAFYSPPVPPITISGRANQKRQTNITGLNALPPNVNVTIFQQLEPWQENPSDEIKTCTWRAVLDGHPVKACEPV